MLSAYPSFVSLFGLYFSKFTGYRVSHQLSDFLGVIVSPLQIHQLGGGSLYGAVSARDDARLEQLPSRIIPSHFHLARYTIL